MSPRNLNDLAAFLTVARERSFTRAAARLGVTPSALSHAIKGLEAQLGVRLLARTTRSVAPTEAGERLVRTLQPHFEQIDAELSALLDLRETPAGTLRISCNDYVIDTIFRPMLREFLRQYPDIKVEFSIDYGFADIVEGRFDAGVRLGEALSKDMIAVPIGPDLPFIVVGSPGYFDRHPIPETPQDLTSHACNNIRMTTAGTLYAWEFEKGGKKISVRVDGQLAFNSVVPALGAALDGHGLSYVPQDLARPHLVAGTLRQVLAGWCPRVQGYHLYYPSRKHPSPAFSLFVNALRYQGQGT